MLGTEQNGMTLCVMASVYAHNMKQEQRSGSAGLAMYAFHDAMERTALAIMQVLEAKRTPSEAYELVVDYATRLEEHLIELDENDGELDAEDGDTA